MSTCLSSSIVSVFPVFPLVSSGTTAAAAAAAAAARESDPWLLVSEGH